MKFSIVIPVYNASAWIIDALDSVINQSYKDFETLIVNDGSTDNSEVLIQNFFKDKEEQSWKLINQSNEGLGSARNSGVAAAEGEWICFLDADDYWSIHKLLHCFSFLKENENTEWLYHNVYELFESGALRPRIGFSVKGINEFLVKGNPIVPSATLIKREIYKSEKGFSTDEQLHGAEDLDLWLRLLESGKNPIFFDEYLTAYRMGSGMTQNLDEHYEKLIFSIEKAENRGAISAEGVKLFKIRKAYEFARQNHKFGNFREAIQLYDKSNLKGLKSKLLIALAKIKVKI